MHRGRNRNKGTFALLCVWAVMTAFAFLQSVETQAQAQWTPVGNLPGGTWSIAPDPSDGSSMYALNSGGISRIGNKGATWEVCGPAATMMRLVTAGGRQGGPLLYAAGPSGLRVSGDGCKTWKDVATQGLNPSPAHVRWLAPYPNNASVLYAGMDGLGGLYRSIDTGANWQPASKGLPPYSWVTALTADLANPSTVYVGLQYIRNDHSAAYIYKSTDGGLSWRSSSLGIHVLPNNGGSVTGLGWSGNTLFAATLSDGIYRSDDRGASWIPAAMPRRTLPAESSKAMPLPLKVSLLSTGTEGALIIATEEGAYQSLDGGQTWQLLGPVQAQGKPALLGFDSASGRVAMASSGGAWSYKVPPGSVILPKATSIPATPVPPTPPPPARLATYTPTSTPRPPTPTQTPTVVPTPTVALVTGPKPTDRVKPGDPDVSTYFEQTGHNISHGFRDFWQANGGLGKFGFPLTDEFVENGVPVQYFERARFEYRDGKITLGNLGTELSQGFSGPAFRPIPFFVSEDTNVYFGPSKHSVSGPFLDFFRDSGRVEGVGYPVSESYKVDEDTEVQWFERARFEWHRSLPEGRRIVLGNIGTETLQRRGWLR